MFDLLYLSEHEDPLHNFWVKCDVFILAHVVGWWAKMMIVRSVGLCIAMSFLFESLEYSLEHQLPNFSECWWDHWILDFIVCNGLGIWLGSVTLRYVPISSTSEVLILLRYSAEFSTHFCPNEALLKLVIKSLNQMNFFDNS